MDIICRYTHTSHIFVHIFAGIETESNLNDPTNLNNMNYFLLPLVL